MAGRLRALPGVLEEGLANLRDPLPLPFVATALADVPGVTELVGEAAPRAAAELGYPGALDEPARRAAAAVARFGDELRTRYCPPLPQKSPAAASCWSTCSPTSTCSTRHPSRSPPWGAPPWPTRAPP